MKDKYFIAIDLGGTNLKIALLDEGYKFKARAVLNTKKFVKKDELVGAIVSSVNGIIEENGLSKKSILGVGLGLPGPIDADKGLVHFFPNIPGWKNVALKSILRSRIKLPVFIDNDANLAALAEYRRGAARGTMNAMCVTLGTGVGAGLILGGKLYRGSAFAAGEFGHMPINEAGPRCNCGGAACLEVYIGNASLLRQARGTFKRDISLEELSLLARKGNKKAVSVWALAGKRLGTALSGVVNLLDLDAVVIGGGVANAGRALFVHLEKAVKAQAMCVQAKHVRILKAKLGSDAGLIGAAILIKDGIR